MKKGKSRKEIIKALFNGIIERFFEYPEQENLVEKKIGDLKLPTGKVVANDPLRFYETEPFTKSVSPGVYPVYLYIHQIPEGSYSAFAEIRFSDKKPVKLELALTASNKNIRISNDEYLGYRGESGSGAFMDESLALSISKYGENKYNKLTDDINDFSQENGVDFCGYTDFTPKGENSNIVAFSGCFGEEYVPSYWCYDSDGEICRLITDFFQITDDYEINFEFDPWGKAYDSGFIHSKKISAMGLDTDMSSGFNHLAVFLRWMAEHNLISQRLVSSYPSLVSTIARKDSDLRNIIRFSPKFGGELCEDHFTKVGQKFAKRFYNFRIPDGFPHCVDEFAEEYLGTEKYNCKEYKDEAYLFVPYNEEYYERLSKYIDDAWAVFRGKM